MSSRFPFYRQDKKLLVWYAKQCLHVLDYLPSIRQRVLELLIDKCLEIDVNIFIKDNGDAIIDDEEEAANKPGDAGNDNDAVMKVQEETKRRETVDILSDKLDALLELLFQHIRQRCKDDVEVSRQAFHELLPIFESSILTTHKSKFVQYCMFLSCGLESQILTEHNNHNDPYHQIGQLNVLTPEKTTDESNYADEEAILYREFAAKLLEIIVDPYRATTTRQSAACYLASFISRASFVSAETICESVSALMRWAEAYIQSLRNDSIRASDARIQSEYHALFYTVCQAAFYIMCFRGQEAIQFYRNAKQSHHSKQMNISDENSHASQSIYDVESIELSTERWTFLCGHQLQPLRFCLESVRSEFLHVAHFFSLIEENVLDKLVADAKRLSTGRVNKKAASIISTAATLERRRQTGGVGGLGRGSNPLKSFFPFDPLLLRQSHEIIEPLYRYWQGPVEEEDVLVIDEGNGIDMDEPAFEMDETLEALADAADEEDEESEDDIDDENSENSSDEDRSNSDDASATGLSHTGTAHNDAGENDDMYASPEPSQHKLLQQKAWTETLKRPRSYSMENGSW
jgi:RNA polymerase I-specific transcription initiation factor RRN3